VSLLVVPGIPETGDHILASFGFDVGDRSLPAAD
jgi:hypothetical protein